MKGWIALDIDGTVTEDKYEIPKIVVNFLRKLSEEGWKIILITGRTYSFTSKILSSINFPIIFGMQNGATILDLPSKKILIRNYLTGSILPEIENFSKDINGVMLVYSGYEYGDFCYWKKNNLDQEFIDYVNDLKSRESEDWHIVEKFDPNHIHTFSLIKFVGEFDQMTNLYQKLKEQGASEISLIKDPFCKEYFMLLITNKEASKGNAVKQITKNKGKDEIIIAAGNDDNDFSLLEAADIKIAMPSSPKHLLDIADYIAPPVSECGIVSVLDEIINKR